MKKLLLMIIGLVPVLWSCATFKRSASFDISQVATSKYSYQDFKYELLKNNDKIKIKFSSDVYSFDFGKNYYAAYKLPDREDDYNILLRSYVFRAKPDDRNAGSFIYYPIVKVLDDKFNFRRNIITKIKIDRSIIGKLSTHKISIKKEDKYIIIHTDSTLFGESFEQPEAPTPHYFAGEPLKYQISKTKFAPIGEVEILTPYKNHKDVFLPPSKFLFELGYSGGGKRIASATDQEEEINAGSGFIFSLDYSFRLPFHPRITLRTNGGYKYDFGKTEYGASEISAFTGEIISMYSFNGVSLGIGYCSHIAPKFTAKDLAEDITFKNAFGPVIIIEGFESNVLLGVKCILMDYVKKSNGEKINATQFGLYLGLYFN